VGRIREHERAGEKFAALALMDEHRASPVDAVWDKFCLKSKVPVGGDYIKAAEDYQKRIQTERSAA